MPQLQKQENEVTATSKREGLEMGITRGLFNHVNVRKVNLSRLNLEPPH
jgi:hypothetical protein